MFENLTSENFLLYAAKNYYNPASMGIHEFSEDVDRIKYVKRLFKRYQTKNVLKERLIINHIIIIYNVFGPEAATRILFFRLEPDLWPVLKTFLIFLKFQPDMVHGLEGRDIRATEIPIDMKLADRLRSI
jgi:hypothetical protein